MRVILRLEHHIVRSRSRSSRFDIESNRHTVMQSSLFTHGFTGRSRSNIAARTPSLPPKKNSYDKLYDKEKRQRVFIPKWKDEYSWLDLEVEHTSTGERETDDSGDGADRNMRMVCTVCKRYPQIADTKSPFFNGSTNFRLDPIKKHDKSQLHNACCREDRRIQNVAGPPLNETAIGAGLLRMQAKERDVYRRLFRTAYAVVRRCKPFVDYEYICSLQRKNGIDLGTNYQNDKSAADFTKHIAETIRQQTADEAEKARYISILSDGSTDAAVLEQEVVMVRYAHDGSPITKLASLVEVSHGNADGIYSAICSGIETLMNKCKPDGLSVVCGNFDGASVMMGSRNGVKTKLLNDHPSALIIHCVAHRLELGILDAVKTVPYLQDFENNMKEIIKLYHYSPKRRRELKEVASNLNEHFRTFADINQVRWVVSKERALKTIQLNLSSLNAHLEHMSVRTENSQDERARARGLLDITSNRRFLLWIHIMLDFLSVVTSVSKKFQKGNLLITEVPVIINDCIEDLTNLKTKPGENVRTFHEKIDDENMTFSDINLRQKRGTRSTSTTQMEDDSGDMKSLIEKSIAYLRCRFSNHEEPPLSYFSSFDFKMWPHDMEDLRNYGNQEIVNLATHFKSNIEKAGCIIDNIPRQWGKLKRHIINLRTSSLFQVYSSVLKSEVENDDLKDVLHLVEIMMTLSPSTAECERQFSG